MRRAPRWIPRLACAIWATLLPSVARGQNGPPGDCEHADREIELALRERQGGHIPAALAVFEDLFPKGPTPRITAQLALAESDGGRLNDAWRHLELALSSASDPWIRSRRAALIIARTELRAQMGALSVRSNVPAELVLNDRRVGALPMAEPLVLAPGVTLVEVRAEGFESAHQRVTLAAGQSLSLDVPLQVRAPTVAAPVPATPPPTPHPSAGTPAARYAGYGLLAAGALSLVGAGVMLGLSAAEADALRSATATTAGNEGAFVRFVTAPGYNPTDRSTETACAAAAGDASPDGRGAAALCDDNARTRTLAWVFGLAGAAAAGAGVALVLLRPGESQRGPSVAVSPVLGCAAGLVLHGAY